MKFHSSNYLLRLQQLSHHKITFEIMGDRPASKYYPAEDEAQLKKVCFILLSPDLSKRQEVFNILT